MPPGVLDLGKLFSLSQVQAARFSGPDIVETFIHFGNDMEAVEDVDQKRRRTGDLILG